MSASDNSQHSTDYSTSSDEGSTDETDYFDSPTGCPHLLPEPLRLCLPEYSSLSDDFNMSEPGEDDILWDSDSTPSYLNEAFRISEEQGDSFNQEVPLSEDDMNALGLQFFNEPQMDLMWIPSPDPQPLSVEMSDEELLALIEQCLNEYDENEDADDEAE